MRELLSTTDPVLISWTIATLREAGIEAVVFDQHMSVLDGSIGILPRRIMVADGDHARARLLIRRSGNDVELPDEDEKR